MAIKNAYLNSLHRALVALDGRPEPLEINEEGRKRTVIHTIPYQLTGKARYAIARCIGALKVPMETFAKAHDGLVKQYATKPDGSLNRCPLTNDVRVAEENDVAFHEQLTLLQEEEADVKLHCFSVDELNLDANPIPSSVLAALEPCLKDSEEA